MEMLAAVQAFAAATAAMLGLPADYLEISYAMCREQLSLDEMASVEAARVGSETSAGTERARSHKRKKTQ